MTSASAPEPTVPDELSDGDWTLTEQREGIRFELPTMRVRDHTLVYEDESLAGTVETATGDDRPPRFFFVTALSFEPSLPPVTGVPSTLPTVISEGRRAFEDELEARGVCDVERRRAERTRTASRNRLHLTPYRGRLPVTRPSDENDEETTDDDQVDLAVGGYLGVWAANREIRMAGGGYPEQSLAEVLPGAPDTDPRAYRDELLDLIRGSG